MPTDEGHGAAQPPQGEDFAAMLAEFDAPSEQLHRGDVVRGRIVRIGAEHAFVDLGGKAEGVLPAEDLRDESGRVAFGIGDEIEATVLEVDAAEGGVRLARRLRGHHDDEALRNAFETGVPIEGTVVSTNKGGYEVRIGHHRAFCPHSHIDRHRTEDPAVHVGQTYEFAIIEFEPGRLVVSRRRRLEQIEEERREALRDTVKVGVILEGTARRVEPWGVFVDLGGVEGLVHVSEMSWARVKDPADLVHPGDRVRVRVLSVDWESGRIGLSMKQAQKDPWEDVPERFPVGSKVAGRVVRLADFGAFVELAPGVEGLLHVSDMTWTRRVRKPSELVQEGDRLEVQVLNVDPARRRISLGLKQLRGDPWDGVATRYAPGTRVTGRVAKVASFGVFIDVEDGVTGLLPASESGTERGTRLAKVFEPGSTVEVRVLQVDEEQRRLTLTRRESEERPAPRREERAAKPGASGARRGLGTLGDVLGDALRGLDGDGANR